MSVNLSCSVSSCTNPVIGQCPGYKGPCGRFYCATHSHDGLCANCGELKSGDEAAQRTYEDYLQIAKRLPSQVARQTLQQEPFKVLVPFIVLGVSALLAGVLESSLWIGYGVFFVGCVPAVIWVRALQLEVEKPKLVEIDQTKPGFSKFYELWKKEKNKEALKTGLAIAGVIVVGAVAAAVAATDDDGKEKRVREVEEGVRRALR